MFKKASRIDSGDSSSVFLLLSNDQIIKLKNSREYEFFRFINENIPVDIFSPLYQNVASRPNAPIRAMVSALILRRYNEWTYEELMREIEFNILTRTALGLFDIFTIPFSLATIFNFQNKILDYYIEKGINLMIEVYDQLVKINKKKLARENRNSLLNSLHAYKDLKYEYNIQALVEILKRIYAVFSEPDKILYKDEMSRYSKKASSKYIANIKPDEIHEEIHLLKNVYCLLHKNMDKYIREQKIYEHFDRVFNKHFEIINGEFAIKKESILLLIMRDCNKYQDELSGLDRETAGKNRVDEKELKKRRRSVVEFNIMEKKGKPYKVSCPYQEGKAIATKKGYKVVMDKFICSQCKEVHNCKAIDSKKGRTYYFSYKG